MKLSKQLSRLSGVFLVILGTSAVTKAQLAQPLVSEDTLKRVSEHVYALVGFPNIGIVVGTRGTLVIDTGLGERNGATVVRAAQKTCQRPQPVSYEYALPLGTYLGRTGVPAEHDHRSARLAAGRNE